MQFALLVAGRISLIDLRAFPILRRFLHVSGGSLSSIRPILHRGTWRARGAAAPARRLFGARAFRRPAKRRTASRPRPSPPFRARAPAPRSGRAFRAARRACPAGGSGAPRPARAGCRMRLRRPATGAPVRRRGAWRRIEAPPVGRRRPGNRSARPASLGHPGRQGRARSGSASTSGAAAAGPIAPPPRGGKSGNAGGEGGYPLTFTMVSTSSSCRVWLIPTRWPPNLTLLPHTSA